MKEEQFVDFYRDEEKPVDYKTIFLNISFIGR